MPKQSPLADEVDKPFWDACNNERLVLQYCNTCARFQHPPGRACDECNTAEGLVWNEVSGKGRIYSYAVIHDTPIAVLQQDQPYNCAVIELEDAPGINLLSHLPGTPVDEVQIGSEVRVIFEVTPGNGQKVPEWKVTT